MATRGEVESASKRFRNQSGIKVSAGAQRLITDILSGIRSDPHPLWEVGPEGLKAVQSTIISNLDHILSEIAVAEKISLQDRPITTFDVLHWLEGNFSRVCLIEKKAKPR